MERLVLSKYNQFKVIEDTVIGVNLCNKMLFALDIDKYDILTQNATNLENLKKLNPAFFNAMRKLGVIRDIEFDESFYENSILKRRIKIFKDPNYRLTINPTLNCNFSCWYCYETHKKQYMTPSVINSIMKFIERTVCRSDIKQFELDWFGGEPLLCYETIMKPICKYAKELCDRENVKLLTTITTNGYLLNRKMIDFFKDINMQSFQITLDGPKQIHNTIRYTHNHEGSYDRIVKNISLIAKELNPQNLSLRINYTLKSFDSLFNIAESFPEDVRSGITVLLQPVWQDKVNGDIPISKVEGLKERFKQAGFKVEIEILHCSDNTTCYADLMNQAVINYDGRVFKCTATDFEKAKEDGILTEEGDIMWSPSLARKISKATFENNYCQTCTFLPICFGPCHKKMLFVANGDDFRKYCYKDGITETLDYIMREFKKTGQPLSSLLEYK